MNSGKTKIIGLFLFLIIIVVVYFYRTSMTIDHKNKDSFINKNKSLIHNKENEPSSLKSNTSFVEKSEAYLKIKPVAIKVFFNELYLKHSSKYHQIKIDAYNQFCDRYHLDRSHSQNQERYFRLSFFHDLLTGTDAINCSSGGILKIPYFWHWISPNPRHKIFHLPDKTILTKLKPPKRLAKYKSLADIDRIPSQFLADLVSDEPQYYHPDCGSFYTFGWCSEREMSFALLLSLYSYDSKIVQEGIHVWSEFWLGFTTVDGKAISLIAKVDNTFDTVIWEKAPDRNKTKWLINYGAIKMVKWYNSKARESQELALVQKIIVAGKSQYRINLLVQRYFNNH